MTNADLTAARPRDISSRPVTAAATLVALALGASTLGLTAPASAQGLRNGIDYVPIQGECYAPAEACPPKSRNDDWRRRPRRDGDGDRANQVQAPVDRSYPVLTHREITVYDTASLTAAMRSVVDGGRIILRPGLYRVDTKLEARRSLIIEGLGSPGETILEFTDPAPTQGYGGAVVVDATRTGCFDFAPGGQADNPSFMVRSVRLIAPNGGSCLTLHNGSLRLEEVEIDARAVQTGPVLDVRRGVANVRNIAIAGPFSQVDPAALPPLTYELAYEPYSDGVAGPEVFQRTGGARRVNGGMTSTDNLLSGDQVGIGCAGVGVCVRGGMASLENVEVRGMRTGVRARGGLSIAGADLYQNRIGLDVVSALDVFDAAPSIQIDNAAITHNRIGMVVRPGFAGRLTMGRSDIKWNHDQGLIIGDVSQSAVCDLAGGVNISSNHRRGNDWTRAVSSDVRSWMNQAFGYDRPHVGAPRFGEANSSFLITRRAENECLLPRGANQFWNQIRGRGGNDKPSF